MKTVETLCFSWQTIFFLRCTLHWTNDHLCFHVVPVCSGEAPEIKKKCICFPKKLYNDFESLAYRTRIYNTYLENLIHCWAFKSLSLHPTPYRCVQNFFFQVVAWCSADPALHPSPSSPSNQQVANKASRDLFSQPITKIQNVPMRWCNDDAEAWGFNFVKHDFSHGMMKKRGKNVKWR